MITCKHESIVGEKCADCGVAIKKPLEWEYKEEFAINTRMREIIQLTIKVAETQIDSYRKKLEKLTYGS